MNWFDDGKSSASNGQKQRKKHNRLKLPAENYNVFDNENNTEKSVDEQKYQEIQEEICRVCRSEGTKYQPLFYPCKCSGSIKYIHQECLVEWLYHSQKKYCELCHHPFVFKPIYDENMPVSLPWHVIVMGLFRKTWIAVKIIARYLLVAITWMLIEPYVAAQTTRSYFPGIMPQMWTIESDLLELLYGVLFECFIGCLIQVLLLSCFLGAMVLREFMITYAILQESDHIDDVEEDRFTIVDEEENENILDEQFQQRIDENQQIRQMQDIIEDVQENPFDRIQEEAQVALGENELNFMEIIGLAGPIRNLFQNALIVSLIVMIAVGLFAFCPYAAGKVLWSMVDLKMYLPLFGIIAVQFVSGFITLMFLVGQIVRRVTALRHHWLQIEKFILVFLKVSCLVTIEVIYFPLSCGIMIDYCLLMVLASSVSQRMDSAVAYPVSFVFIHWLIGSMFMFTFALFVRTCRDQLRPGVLYFVRNPMDPDYQPMKEMVERPLGYQLRRIFASAVIYSLIILCLFGVTCRFISFLFPFFFPFQWFESVPTIPWDVLSIQIQTPFFIDFISSRRYIPRLMKWWFKVATDLLSLRSYLYGGIYPDSKKNVHLVFVPSWDRSYDPEERRRIMSREVTLKDVEYYGFHDLNEVGMLAAKKPTDFRKIRDRYTVVVRPQFLRLRVLVFLLGIWVSVSLFFCSLTFLPVAIGRTLLSFFDLPLKDGFAFHFGFYSLFALGLVAHSFVNMKKSNNLVAAIFRIFGFAISWVYVSFIVFVICPLLLGFCIDLFFSAILHSPQDIYIFKFAHEWVLGLSVGKAFILRFANCRISLALSKLQRDGLFNIDFAHFHSQFVFPFGTFFFSALSIPYCLSLLSYGIGMPLEFNQLFAVFSVIMPLTFVSKFLYSTLNRLYLAIRDDEYLVGKTLLNLERT